MKSRKCARARSDMVGWLVVLKIIGFHGLDLSVSYFRLLINS